MEIASKWGSNASDLASSFLSQLRDPAWWTTSRILVAVAVTLITISVLRSLLSSTRRMKLPPGPRRLPIIGNMHQMGENAHQSLWHMSKIHGPIMYLKLGVRGMVVVSSPDAAQEFIKVQDKVFAGRPASISGKIFTNNYRNIVWAPYAPHWRHMRKICTLELFTQKRLDSFRPPRTEEFNQMVKSIYDDSLDGKAVKLTVKLGHLATNNITRMLLNRRSHSQPSSVFCFFACCITTGVTKLSICCSLLVGCILVIE